MENLGGKVNKCETEIRNATLKMIKHKKKGKFVEWCVTKLNKVEYVSFETYQGNGKVQVTTTSSVGGALSFL